MNLGEPCRIDVGRESMLHAETAAANRNESRHSTAETRLTQKSWTAWIADSDKDIVTRQSRAANDTRKRCGNSTTTMDRDTSQTQNANSRIPGGKRIRLV